MIDDENPDAPLEEVWEIRRRMMEEFGHDARRYARYLVDLQNSPELRNRVVTKAELDRHRRESPA